jgi:DNA polymerase sigma
MEEEDFIAFDFNPHAEPKTDNQENDSVDLLTPLPIPPWVPPNHRYSLKSPLKLLDDEIEDYLKFMEPSEEEHGLRLLTIARLRCVLQKEFPNSKLLPFGSFETKLYLPSRFVPFIKRSGCCSDGFKHRVW